ncbi:MAG: response regulator transcription factor [Gallionellaceae bacterium]|nr:MAG: response regulator transcription factor [Gallionellaceae bacterium]
MRVLIIEDNRDLAANMFDLLEAKGHVVDAAGDGITGLHLALVNQYDAIVLDLMLPGIDGITLCRKLREEGSKNTPVLMITARDSLEDKIIGLEAGADDYLVKPVELREVELRLRVLLRREAEHVSKHRLTVEDLSLNQFACRVRRAGAIIELPPIPYKILEVLMARSPHVVSREDVEHAVWGDARPDSDSLRAHLHLLRNRIDKPFERKLLRTVRGFGYQLVSPDAPDQ